MTSETVRPGEQQASAVRRMAESPAQAWHAGRPVERACYAVAAALVLSGLVHLGVLVLTGGPWTGPLSWRKPTTFGLSFGLTLASVTWVLSFATVRPRTRQLVLGLFAAACVVEVLVITVQAWRGLPSHFGVPGASPGFVTAGAAGGAVAIVASMTVAAIATGRADATDSPSMRLALRAGFGSLLVALALGVYMLARGMVISRGGGDVLGAFAFTAGVKPGHAATMHGVLVLPGLAWPLLRFTDRPEAFRLAVLRWACAGYLAFAGVVVVESLAGLDPWAPTLVAALSGMGAAVLLGAVVAAVRALRPRGT